MRPPPRGRPSVKRWTVAGGGALRGRAPRWDGDHDKAAAQEAAGTPATELRVAAQLLADGRIEVALQAARTGGWGRRILPRRRYCLRTLSPTGSGRRR